jgi:hypothetical protein
MLTALAVSMWQSKIEYGHLSHLSSGESYARLAERPSQSQAHGRRGDLNCKLRLFEARTRSNSGCEVPRRVAAATSG